MKLKTILPAITLLCSLAATAVVQSPTPSPSPSETPQAQPTPESPQYPPKIPLPKKLRVSQGVAQGNLIHKVNPEYPGEAREKHIQGDVILKISIDTRGDVDSLEPMQGDPLLVKACMDAVKQWKYRPYLLNGEPVIVETTVRINFHL